MNPISFTPLYQKRVWGGRSLQTTFARALPDTTELYGESWEISDRAHDMSIVCGGVYDGLSLNTLWREKREQVFGTGLPEADRFPLLVKILDCCSDLSVQVHPPEAQARAYGGEPKTEMWYIAAARPGAKLYVGIKEGVTPESFKEGIENGKVEELLHTITPQAGEHLLLDSGRLHAIGAGLLIYEVQQNSDTTYRVFDWNRQGLDGQPRALHVTESLACIDFADVEPQMDTKHGAQLTHCPYFCVHEYDLREGAALQVQDPRRFAIITIISGEVVDATGRRYQQGDFFLLPVGASPLTVLRQTQYLETTIPSPH